MRLINVKDLDRTPLRCQRLLMRLVRYRAKAEYAPVKDLVVADTLSSSIAEEVEPHVQMLDSRLSMSPQKKAELPSCSRDGATLQAAIIHTLTGWSNY